MAVAVAARPPALPPPESIQSDRSGHVIEYDFRNGAKMIGDIPVCAPDSFERGKVLFETEFSTTFLATHRPTKSIAVRKDVFVNNLDEFHAQNEFAQKSGHAPRIYCIEYYAPDHAHSKGRTEIDSDDSLSRLEAGLDDSPRPLTVYMEYCCGGDIHSMLGSCQNGDETDAERAMISKWICQGYDVVNALHSLNKIHLDVKPENLVVDCRGNIRLIDYGFVETRRKGLKLASPKGSLPYVAPEVRYLKADFVTDYHSFGVLLAVIFERRNDFRLSKYIRFKRTPPLIQPLIKGLIGPESERIAAWSTLKDNPYFKPSC